MWVLLHLPTVVVRLVLGVRRAVAKMEVVIASCIRVTAALEVVPVALPISETLATAAKIGRASCRERV